MYEMSMHLDETHLPILLLLHTLEKTGGEMFEKKFSFLFRRIK